MPETIKPCPDDDFDHMPSDEEYARIGNTIWHCSEEGGGPDVGITVGLGEGRHLWCGEITRDRWEEGGEDTAALGPDLGSWLILYGPGEVRVLGKMVDHYTAQDFIEMLAGVLRPAIAPALTAINNSADDLDEPEGFGNG